MLGGDHHLIEVEQIGMLQYDVQRFQRAGHDVVIVVLQTQVTYHVDTLEIGRVSLSAGRGESSVLR